jgi:hypothetical protein
MTKTELEAIEETHTLGYATYFSEDGSREIEVEVCTHCEEKGDLTYAAEFPCQPLQVAYAEWDEQADDKEPMAIGEAVVSMDGKTERVLTYHAEPDEIITMTADGRKQTFGSEMSCLACMTAVSECSQPSAHAFLHITRAQMNHIEECA